LFEYLFFFMQYLWVFMIVLLIVAVAYSMRKSKELRQVFENQAMKRNGRVNGFLSTLRLTFPYKNHTVVVSTYPGSRYSSPYTRVDVDVDNRGNKNLTIYDESWSSSIGKLFGMRDIQLGVDSFDNKFVIKGNDIYFINSLLTLQIQDKLLAIHPIHPMLTLHHNKLRLNVPTVLSDEASIDVLIDTTLLIVDRLSELQYGTEEKDFTFQEDLNPTPL